MLERWGLTGKRVLLCTGVLTPRKNQTMLVEVLARVRQLVGNDVVLMLIGEGPLRGEIERRAAAAGLRDAVILTGHIPESEKIATINLADVFVFSSQLEGFALAPQEAMACAKPVVALDVASLTETIDDGVSGFLVGAGRRRSVCKAVLRCCLSDNELRSPRGLGGRGAREAAVLVGSNGAEVSSRYIVSPSTIRRPSTRRRASGVDPGDPRRMAMIASDRRSGSSRTRASLSREVSSPSGRSESCWTPSTRPSRLEKEPSELNKGGLTFKHNLLQQSPFLQGFISQQKVIDFMSPVIGPDIWVRWDQAIAKVPGAPEFPWHQDNGYNKLRQGHFQLWVAMTEINNQTGLLWLQPGSHRRGVMNHSLEGTHQVCEGEPAGAVAIEAEPGDAILFSSLLLHRTSPNVGTKPRWAYVVEYMSLDQYDPYIRSRTSSRPAVVVPRPSSSRSSGGA